MDKDKILDLLKQNKNYFLQKYGIEIIGLFGSVARGDYTQNSDIDILYKFKNKKLSMFEYMKLLSEFENYFHTKVDLVRDKTLKPTIKEYIYKDLINV